MLSLQSNVILNYIQNSATDDEIKAFNKVIKEEKKKRKNNNKLNTLLPLTSDANILLRDKILNIEYRVDEDTNSDYYTTVRKIWMITFTNGKNIYSSICENNDDFDKYIDYGNIKIGKRKYINRDDDEYYNLRHTILFKDKVISMLQDIGLEATEEMLETIRVLLHTYINVTTDTKYD